MTRQRLLILQRIASLVLALVSVSAGQDPLEEPKPLTPQEALHRFEVPDGFKLELVLSEPEISQPAFFNFDERGRLWVMNYLQYPNPAGLKMLSRDKFWRAVYDKLPAAPPNHVRGADRITIHEDTTGDGIFDNHKTFVDGLSIATSFVRGRGGVWVLNPPFLLFYPDRDNDDVPDGDPEVHLEGFGIEDTHSCANSLRWGPDGWLYAGQGSTVTGNIRKPGEEQVIHSLGQLIWRYHPETKAYEIFAEGGGNTFGVEFDSAGRLYSGHNGGDTRGFYFVQGGYYQKGFGKHGPLSNPFAFGYFPAMKHHQVARFVHNFVIYDSQEFPPEYQGDLYGVEPMQGQIVRAKITPDGTSFKTEDVERIVMTDDVWFRPVDIKVGPDGAIYFADFYEPQISHREHFAGQIDKERGRIYRLSAKKNVHTGQPRQTNFDFSKMDNDQLNTMLRHPNKWFRQNAVRRLHDRSDPNVVPNLVNQLVEADSHSIDLLWGIFASGGFDANVAHLALEHASPEVRTWGIRLLCDKSVESSSDLRNPDGTLRPSFISKLVTLAGGEIDGHVRSQLLCSARRLAPEQALTIVIAMLRSNRGDSSDRLALIDDLVDVHLPLLYWWAIEAQCSSDASLVVTRLKQNPWIWQNKLFQQTIAERLMRRFALSGTRQDFQICCELFKMAPDKTSSQILMKGFELAFTGRSMTGLPDNLNAELSKAGGDSITFQMRRGDKIAITQAMEIIRNADGLADPAVRLAVIETFGEVNSESGEVLAVAIDDKDETIQIAAMHSAIQFDSDTLGNAVVSKYRMMSPATHEAAHTMLATRKSWSLLFLQAVDAGMIDAESVPKEFVRKLAIHDDERIGRLITTHWQDLAVATAQTLGVEIKRVAAILGNADSTSGDPFVGKQIFSERCGKCHQMFGEGGFIGPDLTTYNRQDVTNILINVVNPSAEIREGFENFKILTQDGRILIGFIADQDNRVVVIRSSEGHSHTLEVEEIEDMAAQKTSLMPEGLLEGLGDQQLRDLFAFIRTSQPLN